MIHALKVLYSKLITIPVIGFFIALPIRLTKRLFGIAGPTSVDRMDMLQRATASAKSRLDSQEREIADLREVVEVQRKILDQAITILELHHEANRPTQNPVASTANGTNGFHKKAIY
ncbi:MAG: hypothetical protein AAF829_05300 [Pseudomonadota bacterium]